MAYRYLLVIFGLILAQKTFSQELKTTHEYKEGKPLESLFWVDEDARFESAYTLRDKKKVGVGATVGGALGLAGLSVEMNFEDSNSAIGGFGAGPGYNSFLLGWRHLENTKDLNLYYQLGYSRWYSNSNSNGNPKNSSTLKAVFNENELNHPVSANFLVGSLGAQYYQLHGSIAGLTFFGEVGLMYEITKVKLIPTGGAGATYYF